MYVDDFRIEYYIKFDAQYLLRTIGFKFSWVANVGKSFPTESPVSKLGVVDEGG